MTKLVFAPLGILAGLIAGMLARKGFEGLWAVIDDEEPPEPDQEGASFAKLAIALAIEGALFRLTKGIVERSARGGFARMTGRWPGEESA
jgi:hypothetical protein